MENVSKDNVDETTETKPTKSTAHPSRHLNRTLSVNTVVKLAKLARKSQATVKYRTLNIRKMAEYLPTVILLKALVSLEKKNDEAEANTESNQSPRSEKFLPYYEAFPGVVMMADLSGFTRLAEQLSKEGSAAPVNKKHIQIAMQSAENDSDTSFKWISGAIATAQLLRRRSTKGDLEGMGAERLRSILSAYFDKIIEMIMNAGGDVIRVAGDAVIALFGLPIHLQEMVESLRLSSQQEPLQQQLQQISQRRSRFISKTLSTIPSMASFGARPGATIPSLPTRLGSIVSMRSMMSSASLVSDDSADEEEVDPKRILELLTVEAAVCALRCITELADFEFEGYKLGLHVALGAGDLVAYHVGGVKQRWQYVLCGEPFRQIESALEEASKGEAVVSAVAWDLIKSRMPVGTALPSGNVRLDPSSTFKLGSLLNVQNRVPGLPRRDDLIDHSRLTNAFEVEHTLRAYAPVPVLAQHASHSGDLFAEVRRISVLFVNLKGVMSLTTEQGEDNEDHSEYRLREEDITLEVVQSVYLELQACVELFSGVVKEFSVDDKGTVMVVGFGLPPEVGETPAGRACLCALDIMRRITRLRHSGYNAIRTTSMGSWSEDEYSLPQRRFRPKKVEECSDEDEKDDTSLVLKSSEIDLSSEKIEELLIEEANERISRRLLHVHCSMGVATGHVFCASVGSSSRQEYAMIGDTVNLSARLMSYASKGGHGVLVDQPTWNSVKKEVMFEELPPVSVKGKSEPIPVYRPVQTRSRRGSVVLAALSGGQDITNSSDTSSPRFSPRGLRKSTDISTPERESQDTDKGMSSPLTIDHLEFSGMENEMSTTLKSDAHSIYGTGANGNTDMDEDGSHIELNDDQNQCAEALLERINVLASALPTVTNSPIKSKANELLGGTIVVEGVIGVGKTVILDTIMRELDEMAENQPNSIPAICFGEGDKYLQTPLLAWRGVFCDLLKRHPTCLNIASELASSQPKMIPIKVSNMSTSSSNDEVNPKIAKGTSGRRLAIRRPSDSSSADAFSTLRAARVWRSISLSAAPLTDITKALLLLHLPDSLKRMKKLESSGSHSSLSSLSLKPENELGRSGSTSSVLENIKLPKVIEMAHNLDIALGQYQEKPQMSSKLSNTEICEVSEDEVDEEINILLDILRFLADQHPVVIVLDNAELMDAASWRMTNMISQLLPKNVLLILSTRPLRPWIVSAEAQGKDYRWIAEVDSFVCKHYGHVMEGSQTMIEEEYILAKDVKDGRVMDGVIRLGGFSIYEMEHELCKNLETVRVHPLIVQMVWLKTAGNPLFVEEFSQHLQSCGSEQNFSNLNATQTNTQLKRSNNYGWCIHIGNHDWTPLPDAIQGVSASRMDQLLPRTQIVLKTASVVGPAVSIEQLEYVIPEEIRASLFLKDELAKLESAGFLRRVFFENQDRASALQKPIGLSNSYRHAMQPGEEQLYHIAQVEHCRLWSKSEEKEKVLYCFRSLVDMNAAYNTLPHSVRKTLHQAIVSWYYLKFPKSKLLAHYPAVVHHLTLGELEEKAIIMVQIASGKVFESWLREQLYLLDLYNKADRNFIPENNFSSNFSIDDLSFALLQTIPWTRGVHKSLLALRTAGMTFKAVAKFKSLIGQKGSVLIHKLNDPGTQDSNAEPKAIDEYSQESKSDSGDSQDLSKVEELLRDTMDAPKRLQSFNDMKMWINKDDDQSDEGIEKDHNSSHSITSLHVEIVQTHTSNAIADEKVGTGIPKSHSSDNKVVIYPHKSLSDQNVPQIGQDIAVMPWENEHTLSLVKQSLNVSRSPSRSSQTRPLTPITPKGSNSEKEQNLNSRAISLEDYLQFSNTSRPTSAASRVSRRPDSALRNPLHKKFGTDTHWSTSTGSISRRRPGSSTSSHKDTPNRSTTPSGHPLKSPRSFHIFHSKTQSSNPLDISLEGMNIPLTPHTSKEMLKLTQMRVNTSTPNSKSIVFQSKIDLKASNEALENKKGVTLVQNETSPCGSLKFSRKSFQEPNSRSSQTQTRPTPKDKRPLNKNGRQSSQGRPLSLQNPIRAEQKKKIVQNSGNIARGYTFGAMPSTHYKHGSVALKDRYMGAILQNVRRRTQPLGVVHSVAAYSDPSVQREEYPRNNSPSRHETRVYPPYSRNSFASNSTTPEPFRALGNTFPPSTSPVQAHTSNIWWSALDLPHEHDTQNFGSLKQIPSVLPKSIINYRRSETN